MLKAVTKSSINMLVSEYNTLRDQKRKIDERMKVLSNDIKNYALKNGEKDDKGSFYCENSDFLFGAVAKKSVTVDEKKLIEFLMYKGFEAAVDIETKVVVNEAELQRLIDVDKITDEDIDTFTSVKTSYSVCCQFKEEITDEVEQTSLPAAASEKPKSKLKFRRS